MSKVIRIATIGILALILIIIPVSSQGWPPAPFCTLQRIYNHDFNQGLLGWDAAVSSWDIYVRPPHAIDTPFTGVSMRPWQVLQQPVTLFPGIHHLKIGMLLVGKYGECSYGEILILQNNKLLLSHQIPDLPENTYYEIEYDFIMDQELGGYLTIYHLIDACIEEHPLYLLPLVYYGTEININWVSICKDPDATATPTVTGTPPDTPTPTPTSTAYCVATDYPTNTPYPTSTPYPTNTPWQTPPMFFTPTRLPTYTPYATCVPTWTPTPWREPTPFRFNVPLTYTNSFGDLEDGVSDFVSSTTGLVDDVSGMLITASNTVSDVTSFAITSTVNISGTPTASSDLVTTFTSNLSGLSHLFGWIQWFRILRPTAYWFLLACLAWTIFVLALKFGLSFFLNVLWPLAQTIWSVVVDLWNAIPFI